MAGGVKFRRRRREQSPICGLMTAMSIPLTRKGRSPVDRDQRIGCGGVDRGPQTGPCMTLSYSRRFWEKQVILP